MAETETNWLQQELKALAAKVGEPVSITFYLLPDDEMQLNIETRSGRHGIGVWDITAADTGGGGGSIISD